MSWAWLCNRSPARGPGFFMIMRVNIQRMVRFAIYPKIQPVVTQSLNVCRGDKVLLTASGGVNYLWSTHETTPQIKVNPNVSTTYYIHMENVCTAKDSVVITIKNEEKNKAIYIPNAFSPGEDDDLNKIFKAYGPYIQTLKGSIFDSWGGLIYSWEGLDNGWNGYLKNEVVKEDVYVYLINTENECGEKGFYKGIVTVIR